MVAGLVKGLPHVDAARFSFLLATPVILAAGLLKIGDLAGTGSVTAFAPKSWPAACCPASPPTSRCATSPATSKPARCAPSGSTASLPGWPAWSGSQSGDYRSGGRQGCFGADLPLPHRVTAPMASTQLRSAAAGEHR